MEAIEKLGPIFYNIALPAMLTFGFGFWMWLLQRRGGSTTVDEFQKLFDEVQEERNSLRTEMERYRADCKRELAEYQNHVDSVMGSEMARYKALEERLGNVEAEKEKFRLENIDLKKLVNRLTEKLSIAQEQIQVLQLQLAEVNAELDIMRPREEPKELDAESIRKDENDKTTT